MVDESHSSTIEVNLTSIIIENACCYHGTRLHAGSLQLLLPRALQARRPTPDFLAAREAGELAVVIAYLEFEE